MIGNWELYDLSEAELHYALADSHLDAAIILASALRNASYPQTFSNAKVIMSLHHHAVELFLKYALSRAGEKVPTHHPSAICGTDTRSPTPILSSTSSLHLSLSSWGILPIRFPIISRRNRQEKIVIRWISRCGITRIEMDVSGRVPMACFLRHISMRSPNSVSEFMTFTT